jgi:hypothetical protein
MQRTLVASAALLSLFVTAVGAADADAELIALDKQWAESVVKGDTSTAEKILSDQVTSVTEEGVKNKKEEIASYKTAPMGERYQPTNYKVTFLTPDIAVMTHGTKGTDAHYSMHVWSRKGGKWQVVATSTTPIKSAAASR